MDRLNFSYNWNNKLNCKVFSTIRKADPEVYYLDRVLEVYLKQEFIKTIRIHDTIPCLLSKLPPFTCFLDTGYCKEETISIIRKMHHLQAEQDLKMLIILCVTKT